jgi:hypothetical protein
MGTYKEMVEKEVDVHFDTFHFLHIGQLFFIAAQTLITSPQSARQ